MEKNDIVPDKLPKMTVVDLMRIAGIDTPQLIAMAWKQGISGKIVHDLVMRNPVAPNDAKKVLSILSSLIYSPDTVDVPLIPEVQGE